MKESCPYCGAPKVGGYEGCRQLFEELLARDYSEPAFGEYHLFTVDCYALQHSEHNSPRSNAFHMLRLYLLLRGDLSAKILQKTAQLKLLLSGYRMFPFLSPPKKRGIITIADMSGIKSPRSYKAMTFAWGRSVWDAWADYHDWVYSRIS